VERLLGGGDGVADVLARALANSPISVPSIGECAALYPEPSRASPFTNSGCCWPSHDRATSMPLS
jgi:hypothetical protein